MENKCDLCGKTFSHKWKLRAHVKDKHNAIGYKCDICAKDYSSKMNLERHKKETHNTIRFRCKLCGTIGKVERCMVEHVKNHSMVTDVKATYEKLYEDENATPVMSTALVQISEMVTPSTSGVDVEMTTPSTSGADAGMGASSTPIAALVSGSSQVCSESVFTLSDRAFKNRLKTYIARNLKNHDRELKYILDCIADEMEDILKGNLKEQLALKFNIFVECVFANVHNETIFHNFKSKNDVLYQYSDISEFVNKQKEKILKEFEECSMKGSGLFYVKLHKLELRVNKYTPLMGGSAYIELPHRYKNSKSLVNIANSDIYCFKYCILSKFLDKEKNFMSSYVNRPDLECKYDWCIDFPVGIKDIAKFEKRNDISINVFALDENDDVFPLRICEKELPDHRDLLYISNENISHYCCITNFSALVKPQLTAAVGCQIAVCKRCFAYFRHNAFRSCAERLKDHESELGYDDNPIQVLPNTQEKYISFVKNVPSTYRKKRYMQMRFLDSFRFMPSSLAQLADNLPKDKFSETKKMFKDKFDLVSRKGVFPYDYLTTSDKLEDNCLPPKEKFFSKLNNEHITEEDYNHAKCVWEAFNIQTLGEYSDLYLKSDTLILTDVFENFRKMCLKTYDLDCMYYYTVPGLAYSAMLKLTGVELQLITDMTMLLLFEQGIRGGICQCVTRHAVANDPKSETFDNSKSPSAIYYVDANNLYGFAMSQKLPYGGFEWLSDEEINNFDLQAINDDSEIGYILEVDLDNFDMVLHYRNTNTIFDMVLHYRNTNTIFDMVLHYRNTNTIFDMVLHYRNTNTIFDMVLHYRNTNTIFDMVLHYRNTNTIFDMVLHYRNTNTIFDMVLHYRNTNTIFDMVLHYRNTNTIFDMVLHYRNTNTIFGMVLHYRNTNAIFDMVLHYRNTNTIFDMVLHYRNTNTIFDMVLHYRNTNTIFDMVLHYRNTNTIFDMVLRYCNDILLRYCNVFDNDKDLR
ncbi:hypothetical protein ANN_00613 [Periplaneta americana]|uniref:C2H2-type domain-containing protein n=1 Tax=Periplaneta americana TaxID=6978 RepID=A0ABQ8TR94_PERAM|nr:hypothetical protein ANN_00613 [Periplaneta americana]